MKHLHFCHKIWYEHWKSPGKNELCLMCKLIHFEFLVLPLKNGKSVILFTGFNLLWDINWIILGNSYDHYMTDSRENSNAIKHTHGPLFASLPLTTFNLYSSDLWGLCLTHDINKCQQQNNKIHGHVFKRSVIIHITSFSKLRKMPDEPKPSLH